MRNKVSSRQAQILNFIILYKQRNDGISPTLDEIKDAVGLPSASSVLFHINKLHSNQLIEYKGVRNIRVSGGQWTPPSPPA